MINWFFKILERSPDIAPEAFGWSRIFEDADDMFMAKSEGVTFTLSRSMDGKTWVFDRTKKSGPGIIQRFSSPLNNEDFQYMNTVMERLKKSS